MPLTMQERQAVTQQLATTYNRAPKKEKGRILDTLIDLTDYNRSYAARVLRQQARSKRVRKAKKKLTQCRPRKYGRDMSVALRKIWVICDCICGKRLAPYLSEIIPVLERFGELAISEEVRQKLLEISPATIDRLLASVKKQYRLKARSTTKPGTLLKHQIPIRTYSEWDEQRPGFVEVDLVSHEGGDPRGDFIQTLDVTDVCTGWTETKAVKNKAQVWVFEALKEIRGRLPFALLGIDSDNVLTSKSTPPGETNNPLRLVSRDEAFPCSPWTVPLWSSTCDVIPSYHSDTGSAAWRPLLYFKQTGVPVEGPSIVYEVLTASTARLRGIDPLGTAASKYVRYGVCVFTTA